MMDVFLKKSYSSRIFPLAIRVVPWVGEEVVAAKLSSPESFLVSSSADGLEMMGSREGPLAMKRRMGSAVASS
jgi:hypothetical protein